MQPRFIKLHPRTRANLECLRRESAADGADRVSKRIHAVLLNGDEYTSGKISEILGVSRSKVSEWLKIYEEQGFDGLKEGVRSGRPSRLDDLQKIILCDIIDSGPIAFGFSSEFPKRFLKSLECNIIPVTLGNYFLILAFQFNRPNAS